MESLTFQNINFWRKLFQIKYQMRYKQVLKLKENFILNVFSMYRTKVTTINTKRVCTLKKIGFFIYRLNLFNHQPMRLFIKNNNVRYFKFGKCEEFNAEDPLPILKDGKERMTRNFEDSNHYIAFLKNWRNYRFARSIRCSNCFSFYAFDFPKNFCKLIYCSK